MRANKTVQFRTLACVALAALMLHCGTSGTAKDLIYAATFGDVEGVRAALRAGANPNAVDASRSSPLRAAAERGHLEIVQLLVDAGADVDLRPDSFWAGRGVNPLSAAAKSGQAEVVAFLLTRGARIEATDGSGRTALHHAAQGGQPRVVEILLSTAPRSTPATAAAGLPSRWRRSAAVPP